MPPSVRGRASSVWQAYCINSINRKTVTTEEFELSFLPVLVYNNRRTTRAQTVCVGGLDDWLGLAAGRVQLHGSSDISSCHTSQPLLGWLFCHPLLTLVTGELLRVAVTQLRQLVTRELLLRELCTRTTQP